MGNAADYYKGICYSCGTSKSINVTRNQRCWYLNHDEQNNALCDKCYHHYRWVPKPKFRGYGLIPCACGCGELLSERDKGRRRRYFINYHQNRGRDNRGPGNPSWKGGKIFHNGYILVKTCGHPRAKHAYVREHILVMEKYLGRYLYMTEVVHHINGNKQDNRIENLQLMKSLSEHTRYHSSLRSGRIC